MKSGGSRIRHAALVLLLLLLSFGICFRAAARRHSAFNILPVYKQENAPVKKRLDDLLRRMTIEEKVRQLDMYSGADALMSQHSDSTHAAANAVFLPEKALALWGDLGVGAVHDLNPTPEQSNAIQKWVISHNRLGIPVLFIEEGLHGFDTGTVFPAPIGLASTWDQKLLTETGSVIAAEARATGVDMILSPVLNLARDPRWGRVEETYGEDPYLASQLGLAYVTGAQGKSLDADDTVIAEPKHFAAYGDPEGGTNTSPVDVGERELHTIFLPPFEAAVRVGNAMGVMAAYNEVDGIPMTDDPYLLKTVLRDEWGFKGFVLSDLGAIERLYGAHGVAASPQAAVCMAVRSGVDMQFYDFPHDVFQNFLIDCVHNGTVPEADLDRAVRSVLRAKFMLGLLDHPFVDASLNQEVHRAPQHLAISMNAALASMTLLKNDDHLLPLSKDLKRITIIGPNGNVARYGDYERESNGEHVSILQGVRALLPGATVTFDDGKDIPAAVAAAKSADVVIMGLGERQGISGEGFDRSSLGLPGNQERLLEAVAATGKPVVLVLENGRPLTIVWAKQHIPAILEAWYPGEFGGKAIAETLFGDYNPAGRLPVTFPQTVGQLPDSYDADRSRIWKYIDSNGRPLFPFGFGLSYTTFRYDHVSVAAPAPGSRNDIQVSVNVTNTGERAGDEVAQVYLREDVSSVETPTRALKAFSRIHLNQGETETVTFKIPQQQIAVWNADNRWAVESGEYTVWVGGSSTATLSAKFYLKP
jgi:beta-glucosidase